MTTKTREGSHARDQEDSLRPREGPPEGTLETPEQLETLPSEEVRRILHELRVHQIELWRQKEELRQAQQQIEAGRARYFDLYHQAPVGYVTLSEAGMILEANLTAAKMLEVEPEALITQSITRFIVKDDRGVYDLHRRCLQETGTPQSAELRMLKAGGSPFWAYLEGSSLKGPDDTCVCRVVISDVSERRRAEADKEALEAQNRQLQKAESLARMAGAIAHHFNNRLQTVIGNLELALESLSRPDDPHHPLVMALHAAHQAAEVSRQMLTYLGQTSNERESLDLSAVCRESLSFLQASLPQFTIRTTLSEPGPAVHANLPQVQQIVRNLVVNASEALGATQGWIHLAVTTVAQLEIPTEHRFPVAWQPQGEVYACLEVADNGCGMKKAELEKCFDPFFSTKFTGRGLGLSVVLGIVKAHGGCLTVESRPERGSSFKAFLPMTGQAVAPKPESEIQVANRPGRGTVLLVDDDALLLLTTRTMIERSLGRAVVAAKDGVEALEVFKQHKDEISCVLCNLTMPRMDGWETLTALRKLVPGIPVILTSGYGKNQVMAGDHPDLPQCILFKPFGLRQLREAIEQAAVTCNQ